MAGRGPALAEHPLTAAAVTGAAPGLPSANTASTAPPDPCASTLRNRLWARTWMPAPPRAASEINTMPGYGKLEGARREIAARAEGGVYGYTQDKEQYLNRLRRIEGQVRGLQRMVEEDKYCIDILTQVSAVTKALQSVALGLLEDHIAHCVTQAVAEGGETGAGKVREASEAIARLVKS